MTHRNRDCPCGPVDRGPWTVEPRTDKTLILKESYFVLFMEPANALLLLLLRVHSYRTETCSLLFQ